MSAPDLRAAADTAQTEADACRARAAALVAAIEACAPDYITG